MGKYATLNKKSCCISDIWRRVSAQGSENTLVCQVIRRMPPILSTNSSTRVRQNLPPERRCLQRKVARLEYAGRHCRRTDRSKRLSTRIARFQGFLCKCCRFWASKMAGPGWNERGAIPIKSTETLRVRSMTQGCITCILVPDTAVKPYREVSFGRRSRSTGRSCRGGDASSATRSSADRLAGIDRRGHGESENDHEGAHVCATTSRRLEARRTHLRRRSHIRCEILVGRRGRSPSRSRSQNATGGRRTGTTNV
jgi:hypothetical protein